MTDSAIGTRGRSASSIGGRRRWTIPLGVNGAESRPSGPPRPATWLKCSSRSVIGPSTSRAYGSSSSLAGLKRWPRSGSNGPCTR